MKNKKEILFLDKLLNFLGISHTTHPRRDGSDRWWINRGKEGNLVKFKELIGFGVHKQRQKILEKAINSYLK